MSETSFARSRPVDEGVSQVSLTRFIQALDSSDAYVRGFVLLRHGKIVAEKYWEPYTAEHKNWVYSASKSFTATAVGMAFDDGLLGLDDKVLSFFPALKTGDLSEYAKAMRVRDLLCMATGHSDDTTVPVLFSGDWEKAFFSVPIEHEPGAHFLYSSGASYMLSSIVSRVAGKNAFEYLRERLFAPLGFGDVAGDLNPAGVFTGGWGLMVCLEDLAKLGQLYLNKGVWEGKRVLSEEWVAMATAKQSDNNCGGRENEAVDWRQGYGFQFWLCQHGAFRADGAAGQYCVVMPEQDAVLALMSEVEDMQKILDIVWDVLLPGLSNTYAEREAALQGACFRLRGDSEDMETARFRFTAQGLLLEMEGGGETCSIESGRGLWKDCVSTLPFGEMTFIPMFALSGMPKKVSSVFHWRDPDTLEITWAYLETPHRGGLACRFCDEKGTVSFYLRSGGKGGEDKGGADFTGKLVG